MQSKQVSKKSEREVEEDRRRCVQHSCIFLYFKNKSGSLSGIATKYLYFIIYATFFFN